MNKLPNELFDIVISDLGTDVDDYDCRTALASLRYVNAYASVAVIPYLFRTIPVWGSHTGINGALQIIKSPHIAKHVKVLSISPRILQGAPIRGRGCLLSAKQTNIIPLYYLLEHLPRLESVEVRFNDRWTGAKDWSRNYSRHPQNDSASSLAPELLRQLCPVFASKLKRIAFTRPTRGEMEEPRRRGHPIVAQGHLALTDQMLLDFLTLRVDLTFDTLASFEVQEVPEARSLPTDIATGYNLARFLARAPNLETLILGRASSNLGRSDWTADIPFSCGVPVLTKLRKLIMYDPVALDQCVIDFFKHRKATVEEVMLAMFGHKTDTWATWWDVMEEMLDEDGTPVIFDRLTQFSIKEEPFYNYADHGTDFAPFLSGRDMTRSASLLLRDGWGMSTDSSDEMD